MSKLTHRLASAFALAAVLFTGLAAQAALPAGYTRLDYIEGTGSAWINSGINPTADLVVQMTIEQTTSNMGRGECALFGNQWSGNGYVPIFSGGTVVFYSNGGNVSFQTALVLDTQYHFTFDATGMTVVVGEAASGTRCNLPSSTFNNVDANLYIFGGFPGRTCSSHRLYSMTMTVGDVCVREFVPAKDADGNVGLYDIADHSDNPDYEPFYKSKTDSNFIAGPEYIDYQTVFIVSATPKDYNTDPATIRYGVADVVEGDELTVPASFARINGTYSCTGYKLYEYTNGDYVEIPGRAGAGNSFTVTAADIGTGRKLVWQWAYALPEDYQQIEYISSTGSQYINAGLVPNTKTTLEMDFNSGTYTETTVLFGQSWSGSRYLFNEQSNKFMFHGDGTDIRAFVANTDMHVSITADSKFILTVGNVVTTNNISRSTSGETMGIFGTGSGGNKSKFTLYSMQISQDGVVVRDFVPCRRKSDGAIGLFDCAYHSDNQSYDPFYVNRGTSEFVAGPDVIDPTAFYISAYPQEFNTDPATILYGAIDVGADRVLSVPTEIPFNNGNYVCTGYKLYEYTNGDYVEIPGRAGAGNSFTVTAGDVGTGRKLVWLWEPQYKYDAHSYVQRNLIAQFDGIDNQGTGAHDPNATTWVDLTGNCEPLSSDALSFKDGNSAYLVNKRMTTTCPQLSTTYDAENGRSTVEAVGCMPVFAQGGDGTPRLVMMGNVGSIAWHSANKGRLRILYRQSSTARYFMNLESSVDANACQASVEMTRTLCQDGKYGYSFYANGVQRTGATHCYQDTASPNQDIAIGQDYADFEYQLKSARFYSDQLTPMEIAYNAAIDQIRFFGADADETINALGCRLNANGVFEYFLSLDSGADGQVKVTTNGVALAAASSVKLWLPEGTPVEVEYLPNTPNDWRFFSGAPSNAVYPTPTKTSFTMAAGRFVMEAGEYPYSDENIVSIAPFTKTTPYVGRVVYTFTDATVGRAPFFLKQAMTYEESLVVAGGGGGSSWNAGGGGGGVIRNADAKVFAVGESMIVTVGAGGVGGHVNQHDDRRGENSVLQFGTTALTALGGGAGVCGTSYDQCDGGSGGGANVYHCGVGTVGQGFNGGSYNNAGGGGGGAEGPGGSAVTSGDNQHGGNGGVGRWDKITGTLHCYGSGGGAQYNANDFDVPGEGGADSGGRGGYASSAHGSINGENGVDGLGGGGGAMGAASGVGGKGGSGTVIVAFSTATGERFAVEPFDAYPIVGAAATPKPVVTIGGTTLAEDADYELYYENNTQNGALAYVVVVGKAGTAYEGQVVRQMFRPAGIHYVKSVATGSGDGSDWANAMNITNAVNGLTNGTYDIWCAAGTYDLSVIPDGLKLPCETAIRGGFAADATDILKKAADGAKTIFDGANVSTLFFDSNFSVGAASFAIRQVVFEDCVFQRSTKMCVRSSSKATPFTFIRCDFLNNVVRGNDNYGTCFSSYNCSSAPVRFKDCRFEGNIFPQGGGGKAQVYAYGVALTMEGCTFVTNGVPYDKQTSGWGEDRNGGVDECVWCLGNGTTATIRDCDFRSNFPWTNYGDHMGIVRFENNVNGTIENCRFVGNSLWGPTYAGKTGMGILTLLPNNNYRQTVKNCTFAYNTVDKNADGCSIIKCDGQSGGVVSIENCIFWENAGGANNKNMRDIHVSAANTTVRYSLFENLAQGAYVNIALDATNVSDDPKFVAAKTIDDFLKSGLAAGRVALDSAKIDEILALDVHLLSPEAYSLNDGTRVTGDDEAPLSPAIDRGNPAADYSNEPNSNGGQINLGGYGNTAEASETPFCDPAIVSVTADYPDGLTQPRLTMQVGGDGVFVGTAVFYISTDGGATYEASEEVGGALNGGTVSWSAPFYLAPGAAIKFYATLSAAGVETKTSAVGESTATGAKPPWEKPGDVVLVTTNGTPNGSGQSWTNSIDLATAIDNMVNHPNGQIWLKAETHAITNGAILLAASGKLCGGFAADDPNNLAKKAEGAKTVFDGEDVATGLFKATYNCASADFATKPIVFEDCAFTRCTKTCVNGNSKPAPFTFIRCDFLNNAVTGNDNYGTCYHGYQCGKAPVSFKDCRFEGNIFTNGGGGKAQIYADTVALTVDGCAFVTNGVPYTQTGMGDRNGGLDQCIWCLGTTTATITNCDFRGNAPWTNYGDHMGIIRFEYNVNGTIANCRFVGNSIYAPTYASKTGMGILTLLPNNNYRQTVRNCTFAFNTVDKDADGCSVIRGDGQDNGIVEIENCIFWQNAGNPNNKNKRDLQVNAANTTVRYSLFEDLAQGGCVNVALDGTNMTGDPKFVSTNKIVDLMKPGLASGRAWLDPARINEILALDVHLLSPEAYSKNDGSRVEKEEEAPLSPMIDSGDPEADYSNEPGRNGDRLNVGGYGNTLEASETPYAEPVLATPTVDYATEYTQPTINLTMGGDGQFNVTVTIWASADGEAWIESEGFVMGNGSTAGWLVPSYFPVGGKIYLKTAYGFQGTPTETSYEAIDVDPTKVLPPWAGKGGDPEKVVHVREGATGKCDGTSWTDAFVNMGQAMRALSATKNEMWIAGTVETIAGDRGTTFSFTYPIMIRGGFTGVENASEQRADKQATAMITGLGIYDGLKLSGSGAKAFESIVFDGGLVRGLYLESGSAAFTNCVFQGNGTDLVKKQFDGRVFFSKNLRPLILSGCTFRNNLVKGPWNSNGNYGHQIRLESSDVYMDGCLFVSNGVPESVEAVTSTDYEGSSDATPGFMLAFYGNDRVFCVRDTRVIGNTMPCASYNGGSMFQIGGFRNRVAFTNCLFKANEVVQLNKLSRNSYGPEQDMLFIQNAGNFDSGNITTEVVNCTFAYNSTVRNVAMGLTVSCSGTTLVKNCIFAGNRMSGGLSRNQLRLDGTATIDHTCFDSTNGMSQATIDKFLAGEGNLLCEPGFYSTTNDLANARVSDAAGSHFDWEHPEKYLNLNVHLVGRAGYIDETTGKKVAGSGKPSPCVDAGAPASPYRRETKPNGRKVNMGCYGNTPYQTQSGGGGVLSVR